MKIHWNTLIATLLSAFLLTACQKSGKLGIGGPNFDATLAGGNFVPTLTGGDNAQLNDPNSPNPSEVPPETEDGQPVGPQGNALLFVSEPYRNLGTVLTGKRTPESVLPLTNIGTGIARSIAVRLDNNNFGMETDCPQMLRPQESCSIVVWGQPERGQFATADLVVVYDNGLVPGFEIKLEVTGKNRYLTGAGPSGGPHVRGFGGQEDSLFAFGIDFKAGVYVAQGDVNGDGVADIIVGSGENEAPEVVVFNGLAPNEEIKRFFAYDQGFLGGVRVASGDVNGDGYDDIITGAGPTGGPHVRVFDGKAGTVIHELFAYTAEFLGGVFVAAGDLNNDGKADIITGADAGGGAHVRAFDGTNLEELRSFFAYDPFAGGVRVAAGDVNGDGWVDIITGPGPSGGPHVDVFDGKSQEHHRFMAYDPGFIGGIYVAACDLNGDGAADIITGAGKYGGPHVKVFDGITGAVLEDHLAYDGGFLGGVRVAGCL